jgi:hypothetical protein
VAGVGLLLIDAVPLEAGGQVVLVDGVEVAVLGIPEDVLDNVEAVLGFFEFFGVIKGVGGLGAGVGRAWGGGAVPVNALGGTL